jgi:hypothetical protein
VFFRAEKIPLQNPLHKRAISDTLEVVVNSSLKSDEKSRAWLIRGQLRMWRSDGVATTVQRGQGPLGVSALPRVSLLAIGGAALIGLRVRFRRSDPRKRNLNFGGLGRRRS